MCTVSAFMLFATLFFFGLSTMMLVVDIVSFQEVTFKYNIFALITFTRSLFTVCIFLYVLDKYVFFSVNLQNS